MNMTMTYDGTMVMPKNYAVVTEDEMTYVDGGVSFYLNSDRCATIATYAYMAGAAGAAACAIAAIGDKLALLGGAIVGLCKAAFTTVVGAIGYILGSLVGLLVSSNAISFLTGCITADRKGTGVNMTWYGAGFGGFSYN